MKIRFFETHRGHFPVQEYIDSLPVRDEGKVRATLTDISERGLTETTASMRQIRGKMWEIKVQPHRIFYAVVDRNVLVLLHGL